MKSCSKCGKELLDEAVICPGCGCEVKEENAAKPDGSSANAVRKKSHKKKLWLLIPVVLLVVVGILAIMILPHPDLKMKDFKDNGYIGALFNYGIPDRRLDNGTFVYENCIEFYGIPVFAFMYEADEGCTMFFDSDHASEVEKTISKYCDLEKIGLGAVFIYYSYKDLKITVDSNHTYVNIAFH